MEQEFVTLWEKFKRFMKDRFNLQDDSADQQEVIDNINKGIEFKGTNLWILMFAIVIACVGLNMNSTAVIIGAMLISPLMGPIMGIGLSLGINDFDMMKKSLRNYLVAIIIGLLTSTLYFLISPLLNTQSELLARTTPTLWDVLIAVFGGLAGIVAQTRNDRISTVIPGVAIATALMPPLCTAGFGLATGNMIYFGGAFYLFFINTVFIALATFFMVRFLKYKRKRFIDLKKAKKVRSTMTAIIIVTIVPSFFIAYNIVQSAVFESNAQNYIKHVFNFDNVEVVNSNIKYNRKGSTIELVLIGEELSNDVIQVANNQLVQYKLPKTKLIIKQATAGSRIENAQLNRILLSNTEIIAEKNDKIARLQQVIDSHLRDTIPAKDISKELALLLPRLQTCTISKAETRDQQGNDIEDVIICIIGTRPDDIVSADELTHLSNWLKQRTKTENVKLIVE